MSTTMQARGQRAHARDRILRSSERMWRPEDLTGPRSTVQHLLTELTRAGELRRVRKGLYWRGRKTPLGMSPPPEGVVISELAPGSGVGPTGLSAANMLRVSTQIPRTAQIAVPGRAPRHPERVTFVSRTARHGRRTARLTAVEVALLETLEGWTRVIEVPLPEAWRTLRETVAHHPGVRPGKLARAARTEPAPVRVRLADLLTSAGFPELARAVPAADPRTEKAVRRDIPPTSP